MSALLQHAATPLLSIGGLSTTATYAIAALVLITIAVLIWWAFFKKKSD